MSEFYFPILTENDKKLPFYPIGIGCDFLQEEIVRPLGYPTFQWIQCQRGRGEVCINGKATLIEENQGMFLYPDEPHSYFGMSSEWIVSWITFGGYDLHGFFNQMGMPESGIFYISNRDIIQSKIQKFMDLLQKDNFLHGTEYSVKMYELLLDIINNISKDNDDSINQQYQRIEAVINFINQNYNKPIALEDMSKIINVTPQHLCLMFRNILNTRPFEYLNSVRINTSKELLIKYDDYSIESIGNMVGFENASYFGAVFRRQEGVSPGNFRKLHGLQR